MAISFNPWKELRNTVKELGYMADCHSHLLTEHTLTREQYKRISSMSLEQKWLEADSTRISAVATFRKRIDSAIKRRMRQGILFMRSYVDIGPGIGLTALNMAVEAKRYWQERGFYLQIAAYPVEGFGSGEMMLLIEAAGAMKEVEAFGFLPSRGRSGIGDFGTSMINIHMGLEVGMKFKKAVDFQVDQKNHPHEVETFHLVEIAQGFRRRGYDMPIAATHCLSMSSWKDENMVLSTLDKMAKLGISMVVCPRATLNNKQDRSIEVPMHNSIAPWDLALEIGVNVAIGTDNVTDLYMPLSDGDIWKEADILLNSVRYQGNLETVVNILTSNGVKALGL